MARAHVVFEHSGIALAAGSSLVLNQGGDGTAGGLDGVSGVDAQEAMNLGRDPFVQWHIYITGLSAGSCEVWYAASKAAAAAGRYISATTKTADALVITGSVVHRAPGLVKLKAVTDALVIDLVAFRDEVG